MISLSFFQIDGVEQLNNVLLIGKCTLRLAQSHGLLIIIERELRRVIFGLGMTNRKDLIDEALLRPGRMEVQVEISK